MENDEASQKQLSHANKVQQNQIVLDMEAVLRLPQGRRVLLMILERCGLYRSAFTGNEGATSLRLGEQNIGLWLLSQIETVGPCEYPQLLLSAAREDHADKGLNND